MAKYRIACIFRGYKCSWFSLIKHLPRIFITTNLISHAYMLQKDCYSTKNKFPKTFLTVNPRKFIPAKYTRYTVVLSLKYKLWWYHFREETLSDGLLNSQIWNGSWLGLGVGLLIWQLKQYVITVTRISRDRYFRSRHWDARTLKTTVCYFYFQCMWLYLCNSVPFHIMCMPGRAGMGIWSRGE